MEEAGTLKLIRLLCNVDVTDWALKRTTRICVFSSWAYTRGETYEELTGFRRGLQRGLRRDFQETDERDMCILQGEWQNILFCANYGLSLETFSILIPRDSLDQFT